jgi:hypothetical protein
MSTERRRAPRSNIVPIPDPARLFDPPYLEAHALVDQVPRRELKLLLNWLRALAMDGRRPSSQRGRPTHEEGADTGYRLVPVRSRLTDARR